MNFLDNYFVILLCLLATLLFLSFVLERIWFQLLGGKRYQLILFPGVVVHEFSHALGCFFTGAKIEEISLFSSKGSFVKHQKPKIPILGDIVISFAPIGGGIAFLWFLASFAEFSIPKIEITNFFSKKEILDCVNQVVDFSLVNYGDWFFWVFLYASISVIICLTPSVQDLKNSLTSIVFFVVILFGLNYFDFFTKEVGIITSLAFDVLFLGIFFGLLAFAISLPIFFLKKIF